MWALAAPVAAPDSRMASFPAEYTKQPWGPGELGAADAKEAATFDVKQPWSGAYYILTGEVSLPASGAALAFPGGSVSLVKGEKSLTLTLGAGKTGKKTAIALTNGATSAWVPFSIQRMGDGLSIALAGTSEEGNASFSAPVDQPLVVTLQKGARLKAVKVTTLPPGMSPVNLDACLTDSTGVKKPNPGAAIDPASVPSGKTTGDGVPIMIGDKAVDVRLAMAGSDFSRRLKWGYYVIPSNVSRPVGTVPGNGYEALHVLAYSRQIPNHVPRMTVCYGKCVGWGGPMEEDVVPVPDVMAGGESVYVQSRIPVKLSDGKAGWLYHLRIPVARAASAWFSEDTQFEFTRDKEDLHNLPDPNEFGRVPVGLPSSVVIVSATAERAPVGFAYVLGEPGNVFHETQEPVLTINLVNRLDGEFKGRLYARSAGPGTVEEGSPLRSEWTVENNITLKKGESRDFPIKVMPAERKKRGWFDVEIGIECDGKPVQVYRTTYAVLAPDTRKAMADSPFGIWEFWWPHASYARHDRQVKDIATLINKGGWRWTYGGSAQERARGSTLSAEQLYDDYKITYTIRNLPNGYQRKEGWWDEKVFEETIAPGIRDFAKNPAKGQDRTYKVLHESRSSDTFLRHFSVFFGGEPYAMPDKEKAGIDAQFAHVVKYCQAVKKADPQAKICLINDYPGVGAEFMKRGMPKDAFDVFGTEVANFMREPERQPDWMCLLGILQDWKRAKAKYGYEDKPIWTTEALYHGTSPANLSLHKQAVIQTREAMLALANGVQRMCAAGCIRDCTDDYRWSNWGQVGLCFREPEMNPKPAYPMYAWLTQVLDQAKYAGKITPDSTSLHILDFKTPAGDHVYPVWCVRGRQDVTLVVKGGHPAVNDVYGNQLPTAVKDERLIVPVTDAPLYVTGTTIEGVAARKPLEEKTDGGSPIVEFDKAGVFAVEPSTNRTMENNWDYPRIKGDFAVEVVQEDGAGAVELALKDDPDPRKLLERYVELKLAQPVVLKDRVEAFTVRVKGNGGWGRVMFELVDAEGRIWTSCGNQYSGSCNASDNRGDSYISFDGWRTLTVAAPGRFPATDLTAYLPSSTEWWPENTPESRQQLADYQKATALYEKAMEAFPSVKKAYDDAKQAHEEKQAEYRKAKAAYDKEQKDHTAAVAAYKKSLVSYNQAKTAYDRAVKKGDKDAAPPVAPEEPRLSVTPPPTPPEDMPKAPVAPKSPGQFRDYGIARVSYPAKLTKVILAAPPHILYVDDEVPVTNRAVFISRVGVKYEAADGMAAAVKKTKDE